MGDGDDSGGKETREPDGEEECLDWHQREKSRPMDGEARSLSPLLGLQHVFD